MEYSSTPVPNDGYMFPGLRALRITDSTINYSIVNRPESGIITDVLMKAASPNAMHDSIARYDSPKCDPEVYNDILECIMAWIYARSEDRDTLTLWLYGPASSGKSAVSQYIAEKCAALGILLASFFFSKSDDTRNRPNSLVATIVYQISTRIPEIIPELNAAIARDPMIFNRTVDVQIDRLIAEPMRELVKSGYFADPNVSPRLILVDGLDECDNEGLRRSVLRAIARVIDIHGMPFIFLISSRPEPDIKSYFESASVSGELSGPCYLLALGDSYRIKSLIQLYTSEESESEKKNLYQITQEPEFVKLKASDKEHETKIQETPSDSATKNETISKSLTEPAVEGTVYWIAAEKALKHARSQTQAISAAFKQYNIGEFEYLVQAGFDESLIKSGMGYLEQIHVFVSADIDDEVVTPRLAPELGKTFSPFSSILFTRTSRYQLPIFTDTGAIWPFDELVLSTASDIYYTSSTDKSPLTIVSLSQTSDSCSPNSSQGGPGGSAPSGSGEESNKGSSLQGKKNTDEGKKQDGNKEHEKNKDVLDLDDKTQVQFSMSEAGKYREIWFDVTSKIMGRHNNAVFQNLAMEGTLIIEMPVIKTPALRDSDKQNQRRKFPRCHAHFETLSFGSRTSKPGNDYKQKHIRVVIDSHHMNSRLSNINPLRTSATDGKVIQVTGSKQIRSRTISFSATASASPGGKISANFGNNNEVATSSQVTQNLSQITEFHADGVIDWGFAVDDSNFQQMAANIHQDLLPTVDFEFFGKASDPSQPERMDFVVASHWSMILPEDGQKNKQSWIQAFVTRIKSPNNDPAQSTSIPYSNLFQVVALKTNPSKLPEWHGYRATINVQSEPNLEDLEHPEDPAVHYKESLPELPVDSHAVNVMPVTFDASAHPERALSMFRERLKLSQSCDERFEGLIISV